MSRTDGVVVMDGSTTAMQAEIERLREELRQTRDGIEEYAKQWREIGIKLQVATRNLAAERGRRIDAERERSERDALVARAERTAREQERRAIDAEKQRDELYPLIERVQELEGMLSVARKRADLEAAGAAAMREQAIRPYMTDEGPSFLCSFCHRYANETYNIEHGYDCALATDAGRALLERHADELRKRDEEIETAKQKAARLRSEVYRLDALAIGNAAEHQAERDRLTTEVERLTRENDDLLHSETHVAWEELKAERDEAKQRAALYHKDMTIVRDQRDAARADLARERERVTRLEARLTKVRDEYRAVMSNEDVMRIDAALSPAAQEGAALNDRQRCNYILPNGDGTGYLACSERVGHEGHHRSCFDPPLNSAGDSRWIPNPIDPLSSPAAREGGRE